MNKFLVDFVKQDVKARQQLDKVREIVFTLSSWGSNDTLVLDDVLNYMDVNTSLEHVLDILNKMVNDHGKIS